MLRVASLSFSHASAGSRFAYQNVMEDLIPLENELRDRQQVSTGTTSHNIRWRIRNVEFTSCIYKIPWNPSIMVALGNVS